MAERIKVTLLCGGFGGARMAHGFALLGDAVLLTVIGNTGDDLELHGLHISPDLDTVMYTLAGLANERTGWGIRDETWSAAQMFDRYGEPTWFSLGDRDLATHIVRTARLRQGQRLTDVARSLGESLGVTAVLLPMSDDRVGTKVRVKDGWLEFQDYFVKHGHREDVLEVRFDGLETARATPEVVAAIESADLVVIAPSNPYVSIAPILGVAGVLDALYASPAPTVALSPIIGGAALRGPAAQMLRSLGGTPTAAGVAEHYATRYPGLVDVFVLDDSDAAEESAAAGYAQTIRRAPIVIPDAERRRSLAEQILSITSDWRRSSRSG